MSERRDESFEREAQPALDKALVLDRLFLLRDEIGLDVEEEDLKYLLGEDDNDFLSNLASLALEHGIDHDEMFEQLGIPRQY